MSANLLMQDILKELDRRIKQTIRTTRIDLRNTTGAIPGTQLPASGNTGSGYTPAPHSTAWGDVTGTPTTLAGYGITDATSDSELATEASDRAAADTALAAPQYLTLALSGTLSNERRLVAGAGISITDGGANADATIAATGGGASLTIEEVDGTPSESAPTKLIFPNGTLSAVGTDITYTPAGGGSIDVTDGTTTVSPATTLRFPAGTITDNGSGEAEYTPLDSAYATDVGDGSTLAYVVTHALGTRDVLVDVRETASPYAYVFPTIEATSASTITVTFATAPTANQYRVIISAGGGGGGGGGGGAPTTANYIVGASDGTLSAETVIPALASHPDALPSSPHADDEEFDSALSGSWSWANQGTAVQSIAGSHLLLADSPSVNGELRVLTKAMSGSYTFTAKISMTAKWGQYIHGGLTISDGTKYTHLGPATLGGAVQLCVINFDTTTAFNSTAYQGELSNPVIYAQIQDDATDVIFRYSNSGLPGSFVEVYRRGRTSFLTATRIGFSMRTTNGLPFCLCADWLRRT